MRYFIVAIALVLLACRVEKLPPPVAQCTHTSDCGTAQICSAGGTCIPQCAADRDCGSGQTCTAGACVFPSGHCGRDADCPQGQVCGANGTCGRTCASSGECGAGFVCLGNVCLAQQPECAKDADCGSGRVCTSSHTCAQSCTAAAQCGTAQTCSAGICVPAPPQCATSVDCLATQVCRQAKCVAQCAADQDCGAGQRCQSGACQQLPAQCVRNSDCPANKACVAGSCADACVASRDCPAGNVCNLGLCVLPAPQCAAASDCATGQACSPAGQCVAACATTTDCASGLTCSAGACVVTDATTATIGGTVTYSGQTNNAGIVVKLTGAGLAQLTTGTTGAYIFAGLPPGLYTITFTAAFSAEGTISTQVSAKAGVTTNVAAVSFTPRGEVRGKVILSGQSSALNVSVFVAGTSRGASTDSGGNYDITGVPPGSQQIVASYPSFNAASVTVTVTTGAVTQVPDLTLQPQVVGPGAVFAFASTPPLTVVQLRAYVYTAVASGGGITSVTYSIAAGPSGMTIDAVSGAVSFTAGPSLANYTVAIAATGGSAIIYQVYNLAVVPAVQQLLPTPLAIRDGDTSGGVSWVAQFGALHRFVPTRTSFDAITPQRSAATTSVALSNGAKITGLSYPGGTVSSLQAAVGTVSATWPGGTIGSVSIGNNYLVAATPTVDNIGTVGSLVVQPWVDTAASMTYTAGTAQSITANKLFPTSLDSFQSGVATTVITTVLTDTAEQWPSTPTTWKLTDISGGPCFDVTANKTNHTLTASSGDLTTAFSAGHRYFLQTSYCSSFNTEVYTVTLPGKDFTGFANRYFDVYLDGAYNASYSIATATNGSFTFNVYLNRYVALRQVPANGFILIAEADTSHRCTLTDPNGNFPTASGGLAGQSLSFAPFSSTYQIDSNTATSIVFRVGYSLDINQVLTRLNYVVVGPQGVPGTVQLSTKTNLSPSALKGQYLLNDANGITYPVIDNTTSAITVGIQPYDLGSTWTKALVVPVATNGGTPRFVMTDKSGGLTGAFSGRLFWIFVSSNSYYSEGTITGNDAATITFNGFGGSGRVQAVQAQVTPNATWAAPLYSELDVHLSVQGTPWSPDALIGRTVFTLGASGSISASGAVRSNTASSAIIGVATLGYANVFTSLTAGQQVYVAETTSRIPVIVTPNPPPQTNDAFVGMLFLDSSGSSVGTITANTTTTVTVGASTDNLGRLVGGQLFAVALPYGTQKCPNAGQVTANVTLQPIAGVTTTLVAGAYDSLTWSYYANPFPVLSNDTSSAVVAVCYFGSLVNLLGQKAALTTKGFMQVTLVDNSSSYAQDLTGFQLHALTNSASIYQTVTGNTTTKPAQITFNYPGYAFDVFTTFAAGTSYYVADGTGALNLTINTNATLTPNAFAGRFVHALPTTYYVSDKPLPVVTNDSSSLTASVTTQEFSDFVATKYTTLQLSSGAVVTLGDSSATFPVNGLLGQVAQFGYRNLVVVSNTPSSVVMAASDSSFAGSLPAVGANYLIPAALSGANRVRAQADGTAWVGVGASQAAIAKVGASGLTTLFTPLGTGKQLQVKPRAALRGTYTSLTGGPFFYQITDSNAHFGAPGSLAGAAVSIRIFGSWTTYVVMTNTDTTLKIYSGGYSLSPDSSKMYLVDTMRLDVTGGGLTPGTYAGGQLWLQGLTYQVRSNDAGSLLLHQVGSSSSAPAALAEPGGAPAWVLTGLRGRRVNGIALNGSGFVAATDDGLALFDGTNWSRVGVRESSGQLPTGGTAATVDDFTSTTVTCGNCNFAALPAGAQLLLSDGAHNIQTNSAHVITLASPLVQERAPLIGDAVVLLDGRGLSSEANDVAVDRTTTWVPFASGLLKNAAGAWSLLTAANTESSPGKGDGLPADILTSAAVHTAGELWVASNKSGVDRLSGTTWTQFTAAGTESSPFKRDGLPGDSITRFSFDGAKTWFAGYGAASFDGTSWATVPSLLYPSTCSVDAGCRVQVVVIPSPGVNWFGTGYGLVRIAP
jgi:Cys-rich repeat protein